MLPHQPSFCCVFVQYRALVQPTLIITLIKRKRSPGYFAAGKSWLGVGAVPPISNPFCDSRHPKCAWELRTTLGSLVCNDKHYHLKMRPNSEALGIGACSFI